MGSREKGVYPIVTENRLTFQMQYPVVSIEGVVELWLRDFLNCKSHGVDMAITLLDKDVLDKYDVPCNLWDSPPRDPLVWRLM